MESEIDLDQLKKARGLRSLSDVGKAVGVTKQQIWNYENGQSTPSLAVLLRLSDLYGISLDKLISKKISALNQKT